MDIFLVIMAIFYILCICGIIFSYVKRKYWKLSIGFLIIIFGLSLYISPLYLGGYSEEHNNFVATGVLILGGFVLVILGIIVLGILFQKINSKNEAANILKSRYATGEITKEQYEQMKKDIEG